MTHYYFSKGKLRGPLPNLPTEREGPKWDKFVWLVSTLTPIPCERFTEEGVYPEDRIEWRYEVKLRDKWEEFSKEGFEQATASYPRRKVAVLKDDNGLNLPKDLKVAYLPNMDSPDDEIVKAVTNKIKAMASREDDKKHKQRKLSDSELHDFNKPKSLPKEEGDPEGADIYCDKCKKHTYQLFTNEGMTCSVCSTINPFGNCSKEDFARYIKDLSLRNDFRSVDDINAYFDKKRAEIDRRFDEYIKSKNITPVDSPEPIAGDGWKYDYKLLKELTKRVNDTEHGEGLSMEEVESVLLAINFQSTLSKTDKDAAMTPQSIVDENFKGLDDAIGNSELSEWYKRLIVTCLEGYGQHVRGQQGDAVAYRTYSLLFLSFVNDGFTKVAQNGYRLNVDKNSIRARTYTSHELWNLFKETNDYKEYALFTSRPGNLQQGEDIVPIPANLLNEMIGLLERFIPKNIAVDDPKQLAMYELLHRLKSITPKNTAS